MQWANSRTVCVFCLAFWLALDQFKPGIQKNSTNSVILYTSGPWENVPETRPPARFIPCLSLSHTGKSPFGACGRASANWGVCNIARARGAACIFARRIRARRGGCPNKNIKISKFSALASDFSEKAHQLSKCHFVQMSECKSVPSRLVWPEKTSLVLAHAQIRPRTRNAHIPSRLARPAKKLLVCANLVSLSLSSRPLGEGRHVYRRGGRHG